MRDIRTLVKAVGYWPMVCLVEVGPSSAEAVSTGPRITRMCIYEDGAFSATVVNDAEGFSAYDGTYSHTTYFASREEFMRLAQELGAGAVKQILWTTSRALARQVVGEWNDEHSDGWRRVR